jgi:Zn-dependent alcohol dehydrogenase
MCLAGMPYYCQNMMVALIEGGLLDGTSRFHTKDGEKIHHYSGQGSLAEYVVVDETTAIKVREDAPLDKVCLLSCGASTGIGMVLNQAKVEAGAGVAVFGCGGVGLAAIIAANLVGAYPIFAVDIAEDKLALAVELGATHAINSSKANPVKEIRKATGRAGVKYAFEAVGDITLMTQALESTGADGMVIIAGGHPAGQTLPLSPQRHLYGKVLAFSPAGMNVPAIDLPRYVDLYMAGKLPLDKLISRTYPLDDINIANDALKKGETLGRSIITF